MRVDVTYTLFKDIVTTWTIPFIYTLENATDYTLYTLNITPMFVATFRVDETATYNDFVATLKVTADALVMFDPITWVPKVKI